MSSAGHYMDNNGNGCGDPSVMSEKTVKMIKNDRGNQIFKFESASITFRNGKYDWTVRCSQSVTRRFGTGRTYEDAERAIRATLVDIPVSEVKPGKTPYKCMACKDAKKVPFGNHYEGEAPCPACVPYEERKAQGWA